MRKYDFIWFYIDKAANIVTILAFLMAIYVFINPEKLSDYLNKIATSNKELSDEIPYWLTLDGNYDKDIIRLLSLENQPYKGYAVPLKNKANFVIKNVIVKVFAPNGNLILKRDEIILTPFGGYTVYDLASEEISSEGMYICISGFSTRNNKTLYEKRVFRPEGAIGSKVMMTIGYEFTDKGWPAGCSN